MTDRNGARGRLSYCAGQVRRLDYDRFLCTLFAPAPQREALFALYAFNLEVAKTRETVSEPMLGRIRLQWWRETIDGIYGGTPRRHEVVEPLAAAIGTFGLAREPFDRLIDAREFDLEDAPPRSMEALERYAEETSSTLLELALAMFGATEPRARDAARHLGIAWALTGLIRSVPFHARAGRQYLPADLMAEAGVPAVALTELKGGSGLNQVVGQVAAAARHRLERAQALRADVPKAAVPVMLPAVLTDLYLRRVERAGYDVMSGPIDLGRLARQARLALAALRGRY